MNYRHKSTNFCKVPGSWEAKISFILLFGLFFPIMPVSAQERSTEISARVDGPYATASGKIAPGAEVTGKVDKFSIDVAKANENGEFLLEGGIYPGAEKLCFDAIDPKEFGKSLSCTEFDAATQDILLTDLFLPPTLGFVQNRIGPGQNAVLRGYGMPGAQIEILQKDEEKEILTADGEGYFKKEYPNMREGVYYFKAAAVFNGEGSLEPLYEAKLEVGEFVGTGITSDESSLLALVAGFTFFVALLSIGILLLTGTKQGRKYLEKIKNSKAYKKIYSLLNKYQVISYLKKIELKIVKLSKQKKQETMLPKPPVGQKS